MRALNYFSMSHTILLRKSKNLIGLEINPKAAALAHPSSKESNVDETTALTASMTG